MPNSLFKYGFCQDYFVSVLRFILQIFIIQIHVYLPSGHYFVLTFNFLHGFMYIHAIELTVGQLLAFLHVSIRVKFTAYCLPFCNCRNLNTAHAILCLIYLTTAFIFQYFSSAPHFDLNPLVLSTDLFFPIFYDCLFKLAIANKTTDPCI